MVPKTYSYVHISWDYPFKQQTCVVIHKLFMYN
jgi:hypothetical protein